MGIFSKFRKGLKKTRTEGITAQLDDVMESHQEITDDLYDELEEVLIMGDVGIPTAQRVIRDLKAKIENDKITSVPQVRETMKDIVSGIVWGGSYLSLRTKPSVILVIGVNGVGKTTTIGKLALRLKNQGRKVILGAADTFRAAAVEQLVIWSERVGVPIVKQNMGSDPASVAFDTLSSAKANDADVVIIDTAGRLHNKINLMNELTKIKNVMKKVIPDAPHEILLVLDGSTGQNAFEQAKQFTAATEVNALAVTKLDGTAKGGVVIGISDHFRIPVKYIGLGEGMEDLQVFRKREFVNSLFGE